MLRAATFSDYAYGPGHRLELDTAMAQAADLMAFVGAIKRRVLGSMSGSASLDKFCPQGSAQETRFLPVLDAAVSLREGLISTAAKLAIDAAKAADSQKAIKSAVQAELNNLHVAGAGAVITEIAHDEDGNPVLKRARIGNAPDEVAGLGAAARAGRSAMAAMEE